MPENGLRILLVEDNSGDVILLKRALRRENAAVEIVHAASGEAALDILSSSKGGFDVVLLDINLPGISGHDVLRSLKSELWLRSLPVVMLSSSQAQDDINASYSEYANLYLVKPVDPDGYGRLASFIVECWFDAVALPSRSA